MDDWRPPSARVSEEAAKAFDRLHEGIPSHLVDALQHWLLDESWQLPTYVSTRTEDRERIGRAFLREFEVKSHHTIKRHGSMRDSLTRLFDQPEQNRAVLLDLLDFTVHAMLSHDVSGLKRILDDGRSAWTVDTDAKLLVERVPGAEAAFAAIKGSPGTAAAILHSAWAKAYGLHPDPTAAYDEAVRAVEAAYCSALLPKDDRATLGKVIAALKQDPAKIQHVWPAADDSGRSAAEATQALMQLLWRNQGWRHGSEDPKAPTRADPEQAKAAVHLALLLISWKVSGSVIPVPKP